MKLAEKPYVAPQGEGKLSGTLSIFLRATGCNLRCAWKRNDYWNKCDTEYTSWKPELYKEVHYLEIVDEIEHAREIEKFPDVHHVVITGGEPFLQDDLEAIVRQIKREGYHITIETNGTIAKPVYADLLSISPKLNNATPRFAKKAMLMHERNNIFQKSLIDGSNPNIKDFQIKPVVVTAKDLLDVDAFVAQHRITPQKICIMPEGIKSEELDEVIANVGNEVLKRGYHMTDRLQIRKFGNKRGT